MVIEAVQFHGTKESAEEIFAHFNENHTMRTSPQFPLLKDGLSLLIKTLEGEMMADPGDWIIKGIKGELYPCKPDIFAATYEPVDTPPDLEAARKLTH